MLELALSKVAAVLIHKVAFAALSNYNAYMIRYKHALALNPYFGNSTELIGVFPPKGGRKHFLFNKVIPSLLVFPNGDIMFLEGR